MVMISHIVQKLVNEQIYVQEAMNRGIVSYGSLANHLKPDVERELDKEVKHRAIVMALRRYSIDLQKIQNNVSIDQNHDVILKSHICRFSVARSPSLLINLNEIHKFINFEIGDLLNIVHGRYEICIVTNDRYKDKLLEFFKGENILKFEENLVSLTLTCPPPSFSHPSNVAFEVIRNIAWDNIEMKEIFSTDTEITLLLNKKDAIKGYKSLEKLVVKKD